MASILVTDMTVKLIRELVVITRVAEGNVGVLSTVLGLALEKAIRREENRIEIEGQSGPKIYKR